MSPLPQARNIDEVVDHLDAIIEDCRTQASRMGYFAALYRRVTVEVKGRMDKGQFRDAERMERLDTRFANRYIEAYHRHRRGQAPTRAWAAAFAAAEDPEPVLLQHLLLGMNAHISLDLGITAAAIAQAHPRKGFKHDFDAINTVLSDLVDEIQDELGHSSGLLRALDDLGGRLDERLCGFCLARARGQAWRRANALLRTPPSIHDLLIDRFDRHVEQTARQIHRPPAVSHMLLARLRASETEPVPDLIDRLV